VTSRVSIPKIAMTTCKQATSKILPRCSVVVLGIMLRAFLVRGGEQSALLDTEGTLEMLLSTLEAPDAPVKRGTESEAFLDHGSLKSSCPTKIVAAGHCSGHATVQIRTSAKHPDLDASSFCARVFKPLVHSDSEKWFTFNDPKLPEELPGGLYVQFPHEIKEEASVVVSSSTHAKVFFWFNNDTSYWETKGSSWGKGYTARCKAEMPSALTKAGFSGRTRGPWYDVNSTEWKPDHGEHMEMWRKELKGKRKVRLDFGKVKAKGGKQSCFTTAGIVLHGPCSMSIAVSDKL